MLDKRPHPRLVLLGLACVVALIAPARRTAANDGMTVVGGKVTVLPVADILRHPANFFDLEGRTVTFTPDGEGRYAVRTGALTWVDTSTRVILDFRAPAVEPHGYFDDRFGHARDARSWRGESAGVSLPFGFPFAGRTWTRVHANTNGNVSFAAPETTHAEQRDPGSSGTMRGVAVAVDSRSAAGLEAMIAVLWAIYGETDLSVDSSPEKVAITWNAVRKIPRRDHYEPLGPNVFQVRLYPSGVIELAYRQVSERDGIVGLFHGTGPRGRVLGAADDDSGDVPTATVDIVSAELVDNGSTVIASMTMADDIPDRVSSGRLSYRFDLRGIDGSTCAVELRVEATGRTPYMSVRCGSSPRAVGYAVQGPTLEIPISKMLWHDNHAVSWRMEARWRGPEERVTDRLEGQPVDIDESDHHLSSMTETVTGNIFEVFHYPSIPRSAQEVMHAIYGRVPADDDLALVFTDFRFDDFFNSGPGSGPINAPVQGIGDWQADPRNGSTFGSDSLLVAAWPLYIGGPKSVESGVDGDLEFHGHSIVVWWIAHELIHRWAAHLRFRNPVSGRIESLTNDGCACHWSEWLHAPVRHPVWRGYSDQAYPESSVMGGRLWEDNGDGTFTRQRRGLLADGLSDLDLYVMGMIPPEEVRPTFLLRDVSETDRRRVVRATKVPVRIEDVVAAMGPRVPAASGQRKEFRLGVYLLHEDGRAPREDLLARTRSVMEETVKYFTLATGGTLPDRSLTLRGARDADDVSPAFVDPDGDAPPFAGSSSVFTARDGTAFVAETVVTGLRAPTSLDFAPDGRLFVTEQEGRVWVVEPRRMRPVLALAVGAAGRSGGIGLLDLALDPDFPENRFVYVLEAGGPADGAPAGRLVRYREVGNALAQAAVLLEGLPFAASGRLRFGPDGLLYAALAGRDAADTAQDLASYGGKILRVRRDGAIPGDNPFRSPVFSLGHHAPGGFDWHPLTGMLWAVEPGGGVDEVNRIEAGGNYGWPIIEGLRTLPGMRAPEFSLSPSVAPGGASFHTGTALAGFRNDLFVAALDGVHLLRVRFDPADPNRIVATERLLDGLFGRLRAVATGPDGGLYFATSNRDGHGVPALDDDRVIRLMPAP